MIVSRETIKSLLKITDTNNDTFIDLNIPYVEQIICDYCKDDFVNYKFDFFSSTDISFDNSTNSILLTNIGNKKIYAGDTIRVYNSLNNNKAFLVDTVNDNSLVINDIYTIKTENDNQAIYITTIDYPVGLGLIFAKMIKYLIQEADNEKELGTKSEKIDDYTIQYDDNYNGFPLSILSPLQKYRQVFKKSLLTGRDLI